MAVDPASPWPLLSVDGGGMRGLVAARMLAEIERRLGRPAGEIFGAGAGTSTGALLVAGALAAQDPMPADAVGDCYREMGPQVFGRGLRLAIRGDADAQGRLRSIVHGVVGDRRLAESPHRLIVPASDVARRVPVVLDSASAEEGHGDALLADVVLASAALPGYFPPVRIAGAELVDGGLWAKDPTPVAVDRLRADGPAYGVVVSLGTGIVHGRATRGRAEGVMDLVAASLGGVPGGDAEALRGIEVLRLEPELPRGVGRLDAASPGDLAALEEATARYIAQAAHEFDRAEALLRAVAA
jgi:predicted acylesterase/phospholipase RssA